MNFVKFSTLSVKSGEGRCNLCIDDAKFNKFLESLVKIQIIEGLSSIDVLVVLEYASLIFLFVAY